MNSMIVVLLVALVPLWLTWSFQIRSQGAHCCSQGQRRWRLPRRQALPSSDDADDDDDDGLLSAKEDWRAFRAKLVTGSTSNKTISWAYDAGYLIEKGSIVLSKVESELGCHDLRQPYFHKCAVLILDHGDDFTKGVVLNRPSDLVLSDQDIIYLNDDGTPRSTANLDNPNKWRMMFGGDIAGLFAENPLISCLHSIRTELARQVSDGIMEDILLTSHEGACSLIKGGEANANDFFTFYGFAGWEKGQLQRELERGSWLIIDVDSKSVWNELEKQRELNEPRKAGLDMWCHFGERVGLGNETSPECSDSFSDLMLKEWCREMLCIDKDGEDENYFDDSMIFRAICDAQEEQIQAGTLVRASSQAESPFLLHEQLYHKSTILIYQEDEELSVGLILNLPSSEQYFLKTPKGNIAEFAVRYGGFSGWGKEPPLIWLHSSPVLRESKIGRPVGEHGGVWTCSHSQVAEVIDMGLAPEEFLLVQGFSVWEKEAGGGGIAGQVKAGNFEVVSETDFVDKAWGLLLSQKTLNDATLNQNVKLSFEAWATCGTLRNKESTSRETETDVGQHLVYGTDVKSSDLADEAALHWIEIFLLGDIEYEP